MDAAHPDMFIDYQRMADEFRTIQQRMAELTATAESDDGLITATVGGAGELLELELDPRIYRVADSAALAAAITGTVRRAAESAKQQGFDLVRSFLPPTSTPDTADLRFDPLLHGLAEKSTGEWSR